MIKQSLSFIIFSLLSLAGTPNATGFHHGSNHKSSRIFNIMSFGAAGNGVKDDSQALLFAWKAACSVHKATLLVPSQYQFLVNPVTFQGPCNSSLIFQIDGIILAPQSIANSPKSNYFQWLNFKWLSNFTIQGTGTINGRSSQFQNQTSKGDQSPTMKPTIMRFYKSYNISVREIQIVNSPGCHLKFDNSRWIKVKNVTIFSSQESLNTDGIHLQNTRDVEIRKSSIGCGDDCVSIQTGCSNIQIRNTICNPGHGISIGGLGRGNSLACVSNVLVNNVKIQNSLYGVRIKTWQGGIGTVKNITFNNIKVSNVGTPIIIDQYYCDTSSPCDNKTDSVSVSSIKYHSITGTYSYRPIKFACSDSSPCTGLALRDVELVPSDWSKYYEKPFCWKSYGEMWGLVGKLNVGCLERGNNRLFKVLNKSHNYTCS
ncbi:hypothetical protein LUZ60_001023 [Juncus effusus]|nr:hypothetical protein LUZ60_001023 [Juncus effusus]